MRTRVLAVLLIIAVVMCCLPFAPVKAQEPTITRLNEADYLAALSTCINTMNPMRALLHTKIVAISKAPALLTKSGSRNIQRAIAELRAIYAEAYQLYPPRNLENAHWLFIAGVSYENAGLDILDKLLTSADSSNTESISVGTLEESVQTYEELTNMSNRAFTAFLNAYMDARGYNNS